MADRAIPVVDLFAGPGGLGEGFASVADGRGARRFDIRLSVEMDNFAAETLLLRTFFRRFPPADVPSAYYDALACRITLGELYGAFPAEALEAHARLWHVELGGGEATTQVVRSRLRDVVGDAGNWVLIGGPPCQAYSVVGRSRNKGGGDYIDSYDPRHELFIEYLQIIADFWPVIFVVENVKGLLSAKFEERPVFERLARDLEDPAASIRREAFGRAHSGGKHTYRLHALAVPKILPSGSAADFVVRAEHFGVPQARHRVILVGVRDDLVLPDAAFLVRRPVPVPAGSVLRGLPRLRSGLSRGPDTLESWRAAIARGFASGQVAGIRAVAGSNVAAALQDALEKVRVADLGRGGDYVDASVLCEYRPDWYIDPNLKGTCNHSTRGHMESDLWRYLYASCFTRVHGITPDLADFPIALLPDHKSAKDGPAGSGFSDRFRVQLEDRPATTIVSHISKDGHYYIHYDPVQCRSLTVREAARLQTFPDNYCFCGPRTTQYTQVGNAVPPLLARQIAEVVHGILEHNHMAS